MKTLNRRVGLFTLSTMLRVRLTFAAIILIVFVLGSTQIIAAVNLNLSKSNVNRYQMVYSTDEVSLAQAAAILSELEEMDGMNEEALRELLLQLLPMHGVPEDLVKKMHIIIKEERQLQDCDECLEACPERCVMNMNGLCFCWTALPDDPSSLTGSIAILLLTDPNDEEAAIELIMTGCEDQEFTAGDDDNWMGGPEPANPSAGLLTLISQNSIYPPTNFDANTVDRHFGHTFLIPQDRCIETAHLEFQAKPLAVGASNDAMHVGFVDSSGLFVGTRWSAYFGSGNTGLPMLETQLWIPSNFPSGVPYDLDLQNLPGGVDLLPDLNTNRFLDIYIQDDTSIDYLKLTVKFCECPPPPCVQPPSGMVAWYPLDEPNGATAVNDIAPPPGSSINNVGTPQPGPVGLPTGPGQVAGQVGGALYFYGPHIEVPPHSDLDFGAGDFSIDAWIRLVGCDPNFIWPIVDKYDGTTGFALYVQHNALHLRINASTFTSTPIITGFANPLTNTGPWYHVAVTVERNAQGIFYIDGVPAGTFTPPTGSVNNNQSLWIGETRLPGARCEIAIDELELFNRALMQQEIQDIFNAGPAGKCRPQPEPTADLGDAPDGSNHTGAQMMAYLSTPVPANFPTVYDPNLGAPYGPIHHDPSSLAWLGTGVSYENEADTGPDQDGQNNLNPGSDTADLDSSDDGVILPIYLPPCGSTQFQYQVTAISAAKLYINVWLDFNRDGDWQDTFRCAAGPAVTGLAQEWAVQNEPIAVGPGTQTMTTPDFGSFNPSPGEPTWMRVTLTDVPIDPNNGADGSGPAAGYKYGETEDYLLDASID